VTAAAASAARTSRSPALVVASVVTLTLTVAVLVGPRAAAVSAALAVFMIGTQRWLLEWRNLLAILIGVVLFMPIGRYTLPGNLPFELEPYRLFAAFFFMIWTSSLLIDRRVRVAAGSLAGPLALVMISLLASDIANPGRLHAVGSVTFKRLTFFASFVLIYLFIVSLVRRARDLEYLVRILVGGGAVLAVFALIEYTTGYNAFNHFTTFLPLHSEPLPYSLHRGGDRLRVFASAQHPIALGALFIMLLPLTAYLWSATRQKRWFVAGGLLLLGNFATQSRTAILMLIVVFAVVVRFRPQSMRRLLPLLLPALLAIHLALPGSLGSLKNAFLPKGGVIAQQQAGAGTYGSGRLADLGPTLSEYAIDPAVGEGFATRITDKGPLQNANILDDQWLTTLVETGAIGVFAWIWLFRRFFRQLSDIARSESSPRAWLCVGLAASSLAFAVGMFTYDAFSFSQVTIVLFVFFGLGSALLSIPEEEWRSPRALR
jgi:hypothetical protein